MKIALIQMPCWGILCPPYGIAVLSSYMRNKGQKAHVRDLNIELYHECKPEFRDKWDPANHLFWIDPLAVSAFISKHNELINLKLNEILDYGVDIVGFSVHFSTEHMVKEFAKRIKEKNKETIIILGGPQASRVCKGYELASLPYIDFVVQGEGELTLEDIVARSEKKEKINFCNGSIVNQEGKVIDCGDRALINDLNLLPFADISDFNFKLYEELRLPTSFSRGCVNRCVYCNEQPYWKRFRFRRGETVFEEVKHQTEIIGAVNYIDFQDSLINGNIRELEQFCDFVINDGLKIRWGGQAIIRKEMDLLLLSKMKKAGCICLNYGLESASPRILENMGKLLCKGVNIDKVIQDTHNSGIDCIINFMFGFPGETEDDFSMSLDFVERNKDYIDLINPSPGFCAFEKGSYGYQHPEQLGIRIDDNNGSLWESYDGHNNYALRLDRFERFLKHIARLGIRKFYPSEELIGRDAVLGYYYFMKKDWDRAILYYNDALKRDPNNESDMIWLGRAYTYKEMRREALECFRSVLDLRKKRGEQDKVKEFEEEIAKMGFRI